MARQAATAIENAFLFAQTEKRVKQLEALTLIASNFSLEVELEDLMDRLAEQVVRRTGSKSPITLIPYEKAYEPGFEDMPRRIPDVSKIQHLIGWQPTIGLGQILDDVIASFRETGR